MNWRTLSNLPSPSLLQSNGHFDYAMERKEFLTLIELKDGYELQDVS